MVTTVLGEIHSDELGVTSSHEHIFIDMRNCVEITGNEGEIFYEPVTAETRFYNFSEPEACMVRVCWSAKHLRSPLRISVLSKRIWQSVSTHISREWIGALSVARSAI